MIENLPNYINIIFILTTLITVYLFYKAAGNSLFTFLVLLVLMSIQGLAGNSGFYTETNSFPPRFFLAVFPSLILIVLLFVTNKGRSYLDGLKLKTLTFLQTVRLPVEIVLYLLFLNGKVPELMTFEGRNFDILAGLTAPFVAYFGFVKKSLNPKVILIWNVVSLGLLLNIVVNAVLSAPFPFQRFAFDQPNTAVLYFPYVWLPSIIVMIVLLSHLASIRQILTGKVNY